jgi:hypothetical protein
MVIITITVVDDDCYNRGFDDITVRFLQYRNSFQRELKDRYVLFK